MNTKFPGVKLGLKFVILLLEFWFNFLIIKFNWNNYIQQLFDEYYNLTDDETILVEDLSYIGNVSEIYKNIELDANRKKWFKKKFKILLANNILKIFKNVEIYSICSVGHT